MSRIYIFWHFLLKCLFLGEWEVMHLCARDIFILPFLCNIWIMNCSNCVVFLCWFGFFSFYFLNLLCFLRNKKNKLTKITFTYIRLAIATWIITPFSTAVIVHYPTIIIFGKSMTSWIWMSSIPELILRCGLVIYPPPVTIIYISNTQPDVQL